MDDKNLGNAGEFEEALLDDENFFEAFIKSCEQSLLPAPDGFVFSVMDKIEKMEAKNSLAAKAIPVIGRKIRAAICFCSAFVIMVSEFSGINEKIFNFAANALAPDNIQKIGEFLNIISKLKQ
ncbi:MAG: hypothetical protein FWG34_06465 [Oscillospiraceae bacterium]|nr:hypothetical protein [Oscillospiraceae bacterium]